MNNPPTLGGAGFLGLLWLGDGAKLPHQTELIKLEPVLLHLAVHHAVDLDAREGYLFVGRRDALELAAVGASEGNMRRDHVPPEKMSSTVSRRSGKASTKDAVNRDQASKSRGLGAQGHGRCSLEPGRP